MFLLTIKHFASAMEFHYLPLLFSLTVILMAAQAALPPEIYWERMLPNTPIPKTIRDLPKLGYKEIQVPDEILFLDGEKIQDGVKEVSRSQDQNAFLNYQHGVTKNQLQDGVKEMSSQDQNQLQLLNNQYDQNQLQLLNYLYGVTKNQLQDGVKEMSSQDQNQLQLLNNQYDQNQLQLLNNQYDQNQLQLLNYQYGVTKNQLQDDVRKISSQDETPFDPQSKENVVIREVVPVANHHHHYHSKPGLFFLEEELRPGSKLAVHFLKNRNLTPLLPRQVAEHIPFSLDKINEILEILAVKPKSKNAENVEKVLQDCEAPVITGEEKYCATSVESMIDFVISKLGKNVHVTSTELENESMSQMFLVKDGVKILAEEEIISCHPLNYPYVMFYCHKLSNSSAYFMPLEGEDGSRVKAVAICHKDTSEWNPNHIAFEVLKVNPGTVPLCHVFPDGNLLWYAK